MPAFRQLFVKWPLLGIAVLSKWKEICRVQHNNDRSCCEPFTIPDIYENRQTLHRNSSLYHCIDYHAPGPCHHDCHSHSYIFWNFVEILGRWNLLKEFWIEPMNYPLEMTVFFGVMVLLIGYATISSRQQRTAWGYLTIKIVPLKDKRFLISRILIIIYHYSYTTSQITYVLLFNFILPVQIPHSIVVSHNSNDTLPPAFSSVLPMRIFHHG